MTYMSSVQSVKPVAPVVLYLPQVHNKRAHFVHLFVITVSVVSLAAVAVYDAFGYQINWQTRAIQQTGLVTISSYSSLNNVQISLNDRIVGSSLPYWFNHLLPGEYFIGVKKAGYQDWSHTVKVSANQTVSYPPIVLLRSYQVPQLIPDGSVSFVASDANSAGLEIRAGNELWVNGTFVTRTSQDMSLAQWYPDGVHVVYQAGTTLWLCDGDGLNTQKIVTFPTAAKVSLVFQQSGKEMYYQFSNGAAWRLDLY
jgi:hypothetical protein